VELARVPVVNELNRISGEIHYNMLHSIAAKVYRLAAFQFIRQGKGYFHGLIVIQTWITDCVVCGV
jgi:hypothetical protein